MPSNQIYKTNLFLYLNQMGKIMLRLTVDWMVHLLYDVQQNEIKRLCRFTKIVLLNTEVGVRLINIVV